MPKISAIICAYNAADTLKKAALSVLGQSFDDIELIVVNDGSSDSTAEVCSELGKLDTRVKLVDIQNGGVARARNIALEHAEGEYVTFCDADDYLDDGAFETMYNAIEGNGSDMLICGYYHETVTKNGLSRVEVTAKDAVYTSKQEIYSDFIELKSKYLIDAMCNKLFRRSVVVENGLKFPEGELFEDTAFNLDFLEASERLTVLNKCYYHYIQHKGRRVTGQYNFEKLQYLTDRYYKLLRFCTDGGKHLQSFCHLYHIRNVYSCLSASFGAEMSRRERKALIKDAINDGLFLECAKNADGVGLANRLTVKVARSKSLFLNRLYCKGIYVAKTKAAVLFTKFKR